MSRTKFSGFPAYSQIFLQRYRQRSQQIYDFTLVTELTLGPDKSGTSGAPGFSGVTGGEYKA